MSIVFDAKATKPIASVNICVWHDNGNPCFGAHVYPEGATDIFIQETWIAEPYKNAASVEVSIVFLDGTFDSVFYPFPKQGSQLNLALAASTLMLSSVLLGLVAVTRPKRRKE